MHDFEAKLIILKLYLALFLGRSLGEPLQVLFHFEHCGQATVHFSIIRYVAERIYVFQAFSHLDQRMKSLIWRYLNPFQELFDVDI